MTIEQGTETKNKVEAIPLSPEQYEQFTKFVDELQAEFMASGSLAAAEAKAGKVIMSWTNEESRRDCGIKIRKYFREALGRRVSEVELHFFEYIKEKLNLTKTNYLNRYLELTKLISEISELEKKEQIQQIQSFLQGQMVDGAETLSGLSRNNWFGKSQDIVPGYPNLWLILKVNNLDISIAEILGKPDYTKFHNLIYQIEYDICVYFITVFILCSPPEFGSPLQQPTQYLLIQELKPMREIIKKQLRDFLLEQLVDKSVDLKDIDKDNWSENFTNNVPKYDSFVDLIGDIGMGISVSEVLGKSNNYKIFSELNEIISKAKVLPREQIINLLQNFLQVRLKPGVSLTDVKTTEWGEFFTPNTVGYNSLYHLLQTTNMGITIPEILGKVSRYFVFYNLLSEILKLERKEQIRKLQGFLRKQLGVENSFDLSSITMKSWDEFFGKTDVPSRTLFWNALREYEIDISIAEILGNARSQKEETTIQEFTEQAGISEYLSFIQDKFENISKLLEPLILVVSQIAKNYEFSQEKTIPAAAIEAFLLSLSANTELKTDKTSLAESLREFLSKADYRSYTPEIRAPETPEEIDNFFHGIVKRPKAKPISPVSRIKAWDDLANLQSRAEEPITLPNETELANVILHEIFTDIFNQTFAFDGAENSLTQTYLEISQYAEVNGSNIAKIIADEISEVLGSKEKQTGITFLNQTFIQHQQNLNAKREKFGQKTVPVMHPTVKQLYTWLLAIKTPLTGLQTPGIFDGSSCGTGKTLTQIGITFHSEQSLNLVWVPNNNQDGLMAEFAKYTDPGKTLIVDLKKLDFDQINGELLSNQGISKKIIIFGSYIDLQNLSPQKIKALRQLTDSYKYNLLCDESHALKGGESTERIKKLKRILNYSNLGLTYLASATPITVSGSDLANQMAIMLGSYSSSPEKTEIDPAYQKIVAQFQEIRKISNHIEQIKALRTFLIKHGMLVAQRELPSTLELPKITESSPQIVVDLNILSGDGQGNKQKQAAVFKLMQKSLVPVP